MAVAAPGRYRVRRLFVLRAEPLVPGPVRAFMVVFFAPGARAFAALAFGPAFWLLDRWAIATRAGRFCALARAFGAVARDRVFGRTGGTATSTWAAMGASATGATGSSGAATANMATGFGP